MKTPTGIVDPVYGSSAGVIGDAEIWAITFDVFVAVGTTVSETVGEGESGNVIVD